MADYVVIPFVDNDDKFEGDSTWSATHVPYNPSLTKEKHLSLWYEELYSYEVDSIDPNTIVDILMDERLCSSVDDYSLIKWWKVEASQITKFEEFVNLLPLIGNDSDSYMVNSMLKHMVDKFIACEIIVI